MSCIYEVCAFAGSYWEPPEYQCLKEDELLDEDDDICGPGCRLYKEDEGPDPMDAYHAKAESEE